MNNNKTWILIADAAKARIFSTHKAALFGEYHPDSLQLIEQLTHNDSRKLDHELVTDKMGYYGSGSYSQETDPKAKEAEVFALQLVKKLQQSHNEGEYRDLILVAPPAFMGMLNKQAQHHHIDKIISQTIEKDYTDQEGRALIRNLVTHF